MSDFNRRFEQQRRAIERTQKLVGFASLLIVITVGFAGLWLLTHPEAIGVFFGRIASGFGAAR